MVPRGDLDGLLETAALEEVKSADCLRYFIVAPLGSVIEPHA
jgi:hypothetical protein